MAQSLAYRVGNTLGRLPLWLKIFLGLAIVGFLFRPTASIEPSASLGPGKTTTLPSVAPAPIQAAKPPDAQTLLSECNASLDGRKTEYTSLMKAGKHWDAALTLRACAGTLNAPDLLKLVKDAEIKSHMADINNPKAPINDRIRAMELMAKDYPEVGAKYEAQAKKLASDAERKNKADEVKLKRSQGVAVGMSKQDVIASSWGKPQSINTTTTATGTRQQWVYGSRSYLYFDDGILTAIQN